MIVDGALIGQIKVLRARESAKALHARILGFLAREKKPELADIRVVYGPGDFDQAMAARVGKQLIDDVRKTAQGVTN